MEKEMRALMESEQPDKISIKEAVDILYERRIGAPWLMVPVPQLCMKEVPRKSSSSTGEVLKRPALTMGKLPIHPRKWYEDRLKM